VSSGLLSNDTCSRLQKTAEAIDVERTREAKKRAEQRLQAKQENVDLITLKRAINDK